MTLEGDDDTFSWIQDLSPEAQKEHVRKDGLTLRWVIQQTPELCEIAVKQNGFAMQYVKNRTVDLYLLAIKQNKKVLGSLVSLTRGSPFNYHAIVERQTTDDIIYELLLKYIQLEDQNELLKQKLETYESVVNGDQFYMEI